MSSFLTNLAARSMNASPAIEPRLGSVFEPGANLSSAPGEPLGEAEATVPSPLLVKSPAQSHPVATTPHQKTDRSPITTEAVQITKPKDAIETPPPDTRQDKSNRESPKPTIIPRTDKQIDHAPDINRWRTLEQQSNTPIPSPNPTERVSSSREQSGPADLWPDVETRVKRLLSEQQQPAQATPRVETDGESKHPAIQPRVTSAEPRAQFETRPVTPALLVPRTPEPLATPPRTIRVTIGRVDVKAVMQAPRASHPKPQPAKAALSLGDYLRRRSEERR